MLGVDVDADDLAAVGAAIRLRLRTEKSSLALLIDTTFKTRSELTGCDLVDLAFAAAGTTSRNDQAAPRVLNGDDTARSGVRRAMGDGGG